VERKQLDGSPFVNAVRVWSFLLAHGVTAALLITLLSGFSWLLHKLGSPMLFDRVPVAYIFGNCPGSLA